MGWFNSLVVATVPITPPPLVRIFAARYIASDLAPHLERGLLSVKDGHLKLTMEGMLLSNEVFARVV